MRERDNLEDVGTDVRIILKWTVRKEGWGVGWINVAQYMDK